MNYLWHYISLMKKSKAKNRKKLKKSDSNYMYYENHHIFPSSLGGSNNKDNKVLLTAREHFVAHLLLWKYYLKRYGKFHDNTIKMCKACSMFWKKCGDRKNMNSRIFSILKQNISEIQSNIVVSEETKQKLKKHTRDRIQSCEHNFIKNHPMKIEKNRKIISISNINRFKNGELQIAKQSSEQYMKNALKGAETRKNKSIEEKTKTREKQHKTNKERGNYEIYSKRMKENNPSKQRSKEELKASAKIKMKTIMLKIENLMFNNLLYISKERWNFNLTYLINLGLLNKRCKYSFETYIKYKNL